MTLLIVAGLFVRSLRHAQRQDPGFDPRSVMNFSLDPHGAGYDLARGRQYYADLRERVRALPGVESASLVQAAPLDPEENVAELELDGGEGGQSRQAQVNYDSVSPEFFRTVRMRMVRGREFSESDSETAPRVAIINEVMAQRFWPATDPIGRQFRLRDDLHHPVQVVGVMHNAQMTDMFGPPGAFFLLPIAQHYVPRQTLMVRSSGPADAVAQPVLQLLRQMAPTVPVDGVMTMSRSMDGISGFLMFRLGAGLASALGLLGLLLAVIGIYGVVSYSAAQRTREIGIRMALGAPRSRVMAAILRQGAVIAGCGIAAGTLVATAIARLAGSFILGVSAFDPATYAGASVLLAAVTLLASLLPARRATRVDPSVVLRQE
jgi:predicted permease